MMGVKIVLTHACRIAKDSLFSIVEVEDITNGSLLDIVELTEITKGSLLHCGC